MDCCGFCECSCTVQSFRKWFLIVLYVCTFLVSATFVALAIVTAVELAQEVYNHTAEGEAVRAPLTALIVGAVAVVLFMVVSLVTLLNNFWGKGVAGFWYGFMTSSTFYGLMLLLLVGVTLDAFKEEAQQRWPSEGKWDDEDYDIFRATFILAYLLAGWYLAFFITLILSLDLVHKRFAKFVEAQKAAKKGETRFGNRYNDDDDDDGRSQQMGAWQPAAWKPKEDQPPNTARSYMGGSDINDGASAYSMDNTGAFGQTTGAYGQSTGAYGQGAYSGAYKV